MRFFEHLIFLRPTVQGRERLPALTATSGQERTSEGATNSEGSAPAFNPIAQWEYTRQSPGHLLLRACPRRLLHVSSHNGSGIHTGRAFGGQGQYVAL